MFLNQVWSGILFFFIFERYLMGPMLTCLSVDTCKRAWVFVCTCVGKMQIWMCSSDFNLAWCFGQTRLEFKRSALPLLVFSPPLPPPASVSYQLNTGFIISNSKQYWTAEFTSYPVWFLNVSIRTWDETSNSVEMFGGYSGLHIPLCHI